MSLSIESAVSATENYCYLHHRRKQFFITSQKITKLQTAKMSRKKQRRRATLQAIANERLIFRNNLPNSIEDECNAEKIVNKSSSSCFPIQFTSLFSPFRLFVANISSRCAWMRLLFLFLHLSHILIYSVFYSSRGSPFLLLRVVTRIHCLPILFHLVLNKYSKPIWRKSFQECSSSSYSNISILSCSKPLIPIDLSEEGKKIPRFIYQTALPFNSKIHQNRSCQIRKTRSLICLLLCVWQFRFILELCTD